MSSVGGATHSRFMIFAMNLLLTRYNFQYWHRGLGQRTSGVPSAANHICQSSRGWWGATQEGPRAGSPGLYLGAVQRASDDCMGACSHASDLPFCRKGLAGMHCNRMSNSCTGYATLSKPKAEPRRA